ncbi:MAG: thioredoxin family protein [Thalassospira sp.]|nr:thioredoxin family protein [Thalassospira sp.]
MIALAALSLMAVVGSPAVQASDPEEGFVSPFKPSENVMVDVQRTLDAAGADGKLALVVMGATWCHDSRALAQRFADPEIKASLDARYEVVFVDVDYLDTARAVNQRFGMPSIYATPTVMIVDPSTERLTNAKTMHQWRNADRISYADTKAYFEAEAEKAHAPISVSPKLADLYAEIDAFEQQQAARLIEGYDQLGPLMRAYDAGDKKNGMLPLWNEVRGFRFALTDDLLRLRADAEAKVASGDDTPLTYPTYDALSWEE